MGNVGLNFGSATSGAGFDVSATVTQIVNNMQLVEAPWKSQLTKFGDQDTALSSLGTQLSKLSTDLQNLTDFTGVLANKQGASSDTGVLQLSSAATNAVAGTHTIQVMSLAQISTAATDAINAADSLTGGITFKIGTGSWVTVNVGDGSTAKTLGGLAAAINIADTGVTANVLTNADGTVRLSLVSQTNGTAGQITIADSVSNPSNPTTLSDKSNPDAGLGLKTIQQGLDASMLVDGVNLTSSSNTVSNAIPGVTFQLLAPSSSTTNSDGTKNYEQVQVAITNDTSSVSSAMSTFVTDYNSALKSISAQESNDASGNPEPLYGTSVLAQLQDNLQSALNATSNNGSITSLNSLGITANQDGTISLNSDTLNSALNNHYSDVISFFQGDGNFGSTFATTLDNLGNDHTYGAISLAMAENQGQETTLNENIANEEVLIGTKKQSLTAELNAANQILQQIPALLDQINEMYSAITGYNKNG